jgi:hypothetical protein
METGFAKNRKWKFSVLSENIGILKPRVVWTVLEIVRLASALLITVSLVTESK